jgi:tetratricopeptide (TPR) repeat protein
MSVMRKTIDARALQIFIVLFILAVVITGGIAYFSLRVRSAYEKINKENVDIKNNFGRIKKEFLELESGYKALSRDRDNLLIQTEKLIREKNLAQGLKVSLEDSKKLIAKLEEEKAQALGQGLKLEEEIDSLKIIQLQLLQENAQLKEAFKQEELKSSKVSWLKEKKDLEKENSTLKNNLKEAQSLLSSSDKNLSKLSKDLEKSGKEAVGLKEKLTKLNKEHASLVEKNKILQKGFLEAPNKFAELARQNKALIKQTANMHYNLGVFYTKNKQYSRAIAEFEKAVELNPEDAHAHFNLGYIYAEYVENRARAVEHFRKYLNLASSKDKDMDWVKKYVITWSSYEAKEPMD